MRPHPPGHLAVQFADAVAVLGHAQPQNKHGEGRIRTRSHGLAPGQDFSGFGIEPFLESVQTGPNLIQRELVMTGSHRGVGGENGCARDNFKRPSANQPCWRT